LEVGWVGRVVLALLIGRAVVLGAAVAAESTTGGATREPPPAASTVQGRTSDLPLLRSLGSWDGFYYIDIARSGYSASPVNGPYSNTVFFPVYPATIRIAHDLTGLDWTFVAVSISNVAFIGACLIIASLTTRVSGTAGVLTVGLLSLAPGSTAFSMAYSESLFLLLSSSAFWLVERGNVRAAAIVSGLAAATRPIGILLVLPLAILISRDPLQWRRSLLLIASGLFGLAVVVLVQWLSVGDPLAFVHGQAAWTNQFIRPTDVGLTGPATSADSELATIAVMVGYLALAVLLAYVVAAAIQFVLGKPRAYGLYAMLGIVAVLGLGRLASAERYAAVLFPVFWPAGRLPRFVFVGLATVSGVILAATSFLSFTLDLAP
jgi:hypothetical protein